MTVQAPYRHESDTSREAAESVSRGRAQKDREIVLNFIRDQGDSGATIDEVAVFLTGLAGYEVAPGTASARISDLLEAGSISKTPIRRKTRRGKPACVHVAGKWSDFMKIPETATVPKSPYAPVEDRRLTIFKDTQGRIGHGHVLPRHDNKKEGCGGVKICRSCSQAKQYYDFLTTETGD